VLFLCEDADCVTANRKVCLCKLDIRGNEMRSMMDAIDEQKVECHVRAS
jgi:hypothetical protein